MADEATATTTEAAETTAAATTAAATAETATATQTAQVAADVASLPDWAQKEIRELRTEAATNRTKAKTAETTQQETMDKIATALGLKPDDDPAKAAQTAAEERDTARKEAQSAKVENAVLKAALKSGANPEALTDSRSFMRALEALDPAADDFAAKVTGAIEDAVKANPTLKTAPVIAPRSGGQVAGGAAVAGQLTAEDVAQMRADGKDAEIVKAKAEGRLNTLLGIG